MKRLLSISLLLPLAGCFGAGASDLFACGDGGFCNAHGLPVVPSGGGTSASGTSGSSTAREASTSGGTSAASTASGTTGTGTSGGTSAASTGNGTTGAATTAGGTSGGSSSGLGTTGATTGGTTSETTGGSTGEAGTTGGSSGGASGGIAGSTTGGGSGTSTGGGSAGAGAPCDGGPDCNSGVCLGNVCCVTECDTGECGATSCDSAGACFYLPLGAPCGPAVSSCSDGLLTPNSTCDGLGTCQSEPMPCPKGLGCNDAGTACNGSCKDDAQCIPGYFCDATVSVCSPREPAGSTCTVDDGCLTGLCAGNCCASGCPGGSCGAMACAQNTGACSFFTVGTPCGAGATCSGSTFTPAANCDGNGNCVPGTPAPCLNDLACDGGTACAKSCTSGTQLGCPGAGYICNGVGCTPLTAALGPCSDANPCANGLSCLGGFCCAGPCVVDSGVCRSTACDSTSGACIYPMGSCGSASCSGGIQTNAGSCATGICTPPTPKPCAPYLCSGNACGLSCSSDADCAAGNYCTVSGACVTLLTPGSDCHANDDCASGVCLGNICCNTACIDGGTCGATGCDTATGACLYPSTPCGGAQSCNSGMETGAVKCTQGVCPAPDLTPCAPYRCNASVCFTSCSNATQCFPSYQCTDAGVCEL